MASLVEAGVTRGSSVALVIGSSAWGLATSSGRWPCSGSAAAAARAVGEIDEALRPRWVVWSAATTQRLVVEGTRVATAWDLAAVHRLWAGGWRAEPARIWAHLHDLDLDAIPVAGQLDLSGAAADDGDGPVRPDGHLRPDWTAGSWANDPTQAAEWAAIVLEVASAQQERLSRHPSADPGRALMTARSESTAELLAGELAHDGLPIDLVEAERIIAAAVGPRPTDTTAEALARRTRDRVVLDLVPNCDDIDLRNPENVKSLLRRAGVEVPDTRAWRLEQHREDHPVVEALLHWRKAERIGTTFGYGWLDTHVGADARLRGEWSASDGAAGRMTAQAGLHNLPAELRPCVDAGDDHRFVRADLGQIEPRVLAAVSGDEGFRRASDSDDLYAPVAKRLGVERSVAKVAILAAMYGQTSGVAGRALHGLRTAYPAAMGFLDDADAEGRSGSDVFTFGGRRVRVGDELPEGADAARAVAAARGRYARNAVVQGAAAELFKLWAVTVRARLAGTDARIVLCLHDELLLHAPLDQIDAATDAVLGGLQEAAARWLAGRPAVRFVADLSVVRRWSDAKG